MFKFEVVPLKDRRPVYDPCPREPPVALLDMSGNVTKWDVG